MPVSCASCGNETGPEYARRTGDYERATALECAFCERLICGRCGSWDYDPDHGAEVQCELSDCEEIARALADSAQVLAS